MGKSVTGGSIGHMATWLIVRIADTLQHFFKKKAAAVEVSSEIDDDGLDDANGIAVDDKAHLGVDNNQEGGGGG